MVSVQVEICNEGDYVKASCNISISTVSDSTEEEIVVDISELITAFPGGGKSQTALIARSLISFGIVSAIGLLGSGANDLARVPGKNY